VREAIKKQAGDTVQVVKVEDKEERTVELPQDLLSAFSKNPFAGAAFKKL